MNIQLITNFKNYEDSIAKDNRNQLKTLILTIDQLFKFKYFLTAGKIHQCMLDL